jgi:hypothetical protein
VSALWQALELYAAGVSVAPLFSKAELSSLRDQLSVAGLTVDQQQRIRDVVGYLNNAPLMARLDNALRTDGVPLSSEEISVLQRIRTIRNDIEHGKVPTSPQTDDLHHAVAIVARILCYAATVRGAAPT